MSGITSIVADKNGIRFQNTDNREARVIDFQPGYWEWIVYADEEAFYSFGDLSEEITDNCDIEQLRSTVEALVENMNIDFLCKEEDLLTDEEQNILIEKMVERLAYHYIDGVESFK